MQHGTLFSVPFPSSRIRSPRSGSPTSGWGHERQLPWKAGQRPSHPVANATLEADGKTYYFISDETKDEFARQRGIAAG